MKLKEKLVLGLQSEPEIEDDAILYQTSEIDFMHNQEERKQMILSKIEEKEEERRNLLNKITIIGECTEQHKVLLAQALKQMKKSTCFTGESINDCFSLEESYVSMSISRYGAECCNRICDVVIDNDVMLVYESIKISRTMYENIRKFLHYQLTVAINLFLYMALGTLLFNDFPLQATPTLFLNYTMDIFASFFYCSELPEHNSMIMQETRSFISRGERIWTPKMVFNVISCTLYQQVIMYVVFYNGGIYFNQPEIALCVQTLDEDAQKRYTFTFVFHVFFSMQIVTLFICRLTYEPLNVFQKTLGLFGVQADVFKPEYKYPSEHSTQVASDSFRALNNI